MVIHTRYYHDVAILSVDGRLDAVSGPRFEQAVNEQIGAGYSRLVADLKKVAYLNSTGIKVLIKATRQTRQHGGDFRIANAKAHVKHALHLAGVDSLIKMYPNVVGATASYFPGSIGGEMGDEG